MLEFWLIASGFIVLALAFVIPPFFKKNPVIQETRQNNLNIAIYKERLAELEPDHLTPEQRAQAKQELDKTLLQEVQEPSNLVQQPRARWASAIVAVGIPALAVGGYLKLGSPHLLVGQTPQVNPIQAESGQHLPADFDKMVANLSARLQKQPDDAEGWYMLARSYTYLKRYQEAAQAYSKVLALGGEQNPQLLTDFAEALALANEGKFAGQAAILLKTALDLDPNYQHALWLSGFAAAQKADYQAAIDYWQRFLAQLPPEEVEARQTLEQHIADARQLLDQSTTTNALPAAASEPESTTTHPVTAQPDTSNLTKLEVYVRLDPTLQAQVKPTDTLFIYARPTQGSSMPLAIVKKSASELPIHVTLDDSMAMEPTMKLSHFQEITVLARISASGTATLQSGDLQGQVSPVSVAKPSKIEIVINEVVP